MEKLLWIELKKNDQLSKHRSIDWETLEHKFKVPIPFLQQQAFWLYQHQLNQLHQAQQRLRQHAQQPKALPKRPQELETNYPDLLGRLFKPEYHESFAGSFAQDSPGFPNNSRSPSTGARNEFSGSSFGESKGSSVTDTEAHDEEKQLQDITTHLHTSRILLARPPTFDDEEDNDGEGSQDLEDARQSGHARGTGGRLATVEEHIQGQLNVPQSGTSGSNKSPLLDQIKFLASKYR